MRLATIAIAVALVPTVGIGMAVGAGPGHGYTDFRTELSTATAVLPGAKAAVLAECDPGESAAGGGFAVAGDHPGVEVLASERVTVAEQVEGWVVTVRNDTADQQFVTARAVCESP